VLKNPDVLFNEQWQSVHPVKIRFSRHKFAGEPLAQVRDSSVPDSLHLYRVGETHGWRPANVSIPSAVLLAASDICANNSLNSASARLFSVHDMVVSPR
jgi:hypothetical protein